MLFITYYRLKMIVKDKAFLLIIIAFATLLSGINSYVLRNEKNNNIAIIVVDEDGTRTSNNFINLLLDQKSLKINTTSRKEGISLIESNRAESLYIIKKGFESKITSGNANNILESAKPIKGQSGELCDEIVASLVQRMTLGEEAYRKIAEKSKLIEKKT